MNGALDHSDQPDPDAIKMFVGQIPRSWSEKELKELFEPYGAVYQINVLRDRSQNPPQSKGTDGGGRAVGVPGGRWGGGLPGRCGRGTARGAPAAPRAPRPARLLPAPPPARRGQVDRAGGARASAGRGRPRLCPPRASPSRGHLPGSRQRRLRSGAAAARARRRVSQPCVSGARSCRSAPPRDCSCDDNCISLFRGRWGMLKRLRNSGLPAAWGIKGALLGGASPAPRVWMGMAR